MSAATVKVSFVNQPKKHPKFGSIKDVDGTYYSVPKAMLAQFSEGGTYDITYDTSDAGYHTVKTIQLKQPPAAGGGGGSKYGATDDATAERIYCCGALNAFIQAGKIEPTMEAVKKATLALRGAWAATFGAPKTAPAATRTREQNEDEMNDSVPF